MKFLSKSYLCLYLNRTIKIFQLVIVYAKIETRTRFDTKEIID